MNGPKGRRRRRPREMQSTVGRAVPQRQRDTLTPMETREPNHPEIEGGGTCFSNQYLGLVNYREEGILSALASEEIDAAAATGNHVRAD